MVETTQLNLPLLSAAQAQKHVTVNEALTRLDAAVQLRFVSSTMISPPATAEDGAAYLVPAGAGGDWQGRTGQVAVFSNGGWVFLLPKSGWQAWDEGRAAQYTFDGAFWVADAFSVSKNGAAMCLRTVEFDHSIAPGASNLTAFRIPTQAQVVGVTGRVVAALVGSGLTAWRIGVSGSDNRYGSGLGVGLNSLLIGLSGTPVTYFAETPLLISTEGGTFTAGTIRLAVHLVFLAPPRMV